MDLALSPDQEILVDALRTLLARRAGPGRAREVGDAIDRPLLDALHGAGFLDIASPEGGGWLEAMLVVEEAEAASARAPVAARALTAPLVLRDAPLAVGLVDTAASALVRYAGHCDTYLVLDGDDARCVDRGDVEVRAFSTRWGYPLGTVDVRRARLLAPGSGARLRTGWQLSVAAEMASSMQQAVALTARYVAQRTQFGRPIGSFQAVSHRLARAAVAAEGSTWLARRAAAAIDDPRMAAVAATYAADAARQVVEATHQVTGAIGITREYDLVLSTMRLGVLHSELGGAAGHAMALADLQWPVAG